MPGQQGVVYTKEWVVDLILDVAGYAPDRSLWKKRAVEPSCGEGSFLGPMVRRLSASAKADGRFSPAHLAGAISAYDLDEGAVRASRDVVRSELVAQGMDEGDAGSLASSWVKAGDYLLTDQPRADFVVGNPPYLRSTDIPLEAREEYCRRFSAMTRGCDIYVAFMQHGLESLGPDGSLCFICADRWMQNQYGRRLRSYVSERFHISAILKMHGVDAFESQVSAYPAIVLLDEGEGDIRYVDCAPGFSTGDVPAVMGWLDGETGHVGGPNFSAGLLPTPEGASNLPLVSPARATLVADLMRRFPTIEETGVRMGIGVATGRDKVFLTEDEGLVEPERMLPVFSMRDWRRGRGDRRKWLVNPWDDDGTLVDLDRYPRTKSYFEANEESLRSRHVARRDEESWYRTIDKVNPTLVGRPMLLFPDMASRAEPVLSDGSRYPCHNCYWLVSDSWDLEVLGGLLMSETAESFVDALGVKMRGGTLRFQAQYLRLIHVPRMEDLSDATKEDLRNAFRSSDREAASLAARDAYEL